ncbi:MAG: multiheme c-type cytochrome [Myxococcota bacterium]
MQSTLAPGAGVGLDRESTLGPFLARYWSLPVPPQGPPPRSFSAPEASLEPATCGACHPLQLAQWQTSVHAHSWTPGLEGQLIEGSLSHPAQARSCHTCHTPLAEQIPYTATLDANPDFDPALRAQGLVCAGCHVRAHRRHGPVRRAGAGPPADPAPHAGFVAHPEFGESRFCAECHQFFDDAGISGKPVENTWAEWRDSPQAREGRTCQTCHMPDRAHLWRGIHDADWVRQALDIELQARSPNASVLLVRNRDVGHAFPTYVTPQVRLEIEQEDSAGNPIEGTSVYALIGRDLDLSTGRERSDTRVLPGQTVSLDYERPRHPRARALVARVWIDPDHYYREMYRVLLPSLRDPRARAEIERARSRIEKSGYLLREIRQLLR